MTIGPGLTTVHGTSIFYSSQQKCNGDLGTHHRKQRRMLNPVFSASHMRNLTPVFYEITHKVRPVGFPGSWCRRAERNILR